MLVPKKSIVRITRKFVGIHGWIRYLFGIASLKTVQGYVLKYIIEMYLLHILIYSPTVTLSNFIVVRVGMARNYNHMKILQL